MRLAILIMAHHQPKQLAILCKSLQHPKIDIFIHIDKHANNVDFTSAIKEYKYRLISKSIFVKWGGFSIVQSIINSYQEILASGTYDYICNISGQDLPIQPLDNLLEFLSIHKGDEFIENIPSNSEHPWWIENSIRVTKFSFINLNFPGKYRLENIINKITPARKLKDNYIFSGNSGWFCLTSNAVEWVITTYKQDRSYNLFFKYVWGADEIYFSTILYNSFFRSKMKGNLVFTQWNTLNRLHPQLLTLDAFDELIQSKKFFARKFDLASDSQIIIKILNHISKNNA